VLCYKHIETQLTFAAYCIGAFAFWGSFMWVFFFGMGLVAIPFSNIIAYLDRPKPMKEDEFKKKKDELTKKIEFMLAKGRTLYEAKMKLDDDKAKKTGDASNVFKAMRKGRALEKQQHEFEANCIIVENEFRVLDKVAQFNKKVEPCKYLARYVMGLLGIVFFFVIFVQMWTGATLRSAGKVKSPYLSRDLELLYLDKNWSFMSIVGFCFFAVYMFYATFLGSVKFGLRFFSVALYPMVPGETFTNSFIINVFFMNIWMYSLIYHIVNLFRQFFSGS